MEPGAFELPAVRPLPTPKASLVRAAAIQPGRRGARFPNEKHSTLSEVLEYQFEKSWLYSAD
jgi:hypothetical protein